MALLPPPPLPRANLIPSRFVALDGLRAVGALAVLTTHVGFNSADGINGRYAGLIGRLDVGVALFFVVSGFLLFRPHVAAHLDGRSRPDTRTYLWRRAVRILPVLWVAVAGAWLLLPSTKDPGLYLAHAFLFQIYVPDHHLHGLTQMWSLATEVTFYLALPALAWFLCRGEGDRRWLRRTATTLAAISLISPVWMGVTTAMGYSLPRLWLPGFISWFAAGMILALWDVGKERGMLRPGQLDSLAHHTGTCWALAAGFFLLATTPLAGPLDLASPSTAEVTVKNVLYLLIGAFIVLPCIPRRADRDPATSLLAGRVGRVLGDVSYGIFAYHVILLAMVERWLGLSSFDGEFLRRLLPTAVLSVLVAAVSYYGMERRLMARSRPGFGGVRGRESPQPAMSPASTRELLR